MKLKKGTFSSQITICVFLLIFSIALRLSPTHSFPKVKAAIVSVLTVHTDLNEQWQKLKDRFAQEQNLDVFAPVSNMTAPSSGHVIKGFGMQDASKNSFHYGVVLSCGETENILAANDGTVTEIATNNEYGSFILIQHSEEIYTLYGGLNEILPGIGETVTAGQPIARPGTENSFYFELRRGDTFLNPAEYITFSEAPHD